MAQARASEIVGHLGGVAMFSKCSRKDLQNIARNAELVDLPNSTQIVTQGQAGDAFYVLLEGKAVVRRNGRKVGELGAGDYFGELALLDPAPRNADVIALTPVKLARLDAKSFRELLRAVPILSERLLAGLARRLRDADRKSVE